MKNRKQSSERLQLLENLIAEVVKEAAGLCGGTCWVWTGLGENGGIFHTLLGTRACLFSSFLINWLLYWCILGGECSGAPPPDPFGTEVRYFILKQHLFEKEVIS